MTTLIKAAKETRSFTASKVDNMVCALLVLISLAVRSPLLISFSHSTSLLRVSHQLIVDDPFFLYLLFVLFSLFHFPLGAELSHFSRDQNNVTSTNQTRKFSVSSIVAASRE